MVEFFYANQFIIAQVFGFLAMFTAAAMYQFKKHKTILLLMVLCSGLWCCHFASMGLFTPVAINFLNVVRNFVYSMREKKWTNSVAIPIVFMVASVISVILTWENGWSILPFIASIFAITAGWQKNTKFLKVLTIPVCICWFTYNFVNHSWAGMCNEVFAFTSIVVALIRYRAKKN